MKAEFWYPVKPYLITQEWGLYRPEVYAQFGFNCHNGVDVAMTQDAKIRAPFDCRVVDIGFHPRGSGLYVSVISDNDYEFPDGKTSRVLVDFLHCESIYVDVGDRCLVGTALARQDNTGFSTGPHTHMQFRRCQYDGAVRTFIDKNDANNSFDPTPYWNGAYAEAWSLWGSIKEQWEAILKALQK